jgi:hypothetical protein
MHWENFRRSALNFGFGPPLAAALLGPVDPPQADNASAHAPATNGVKWSLCMGSVVWQRS